MSGWVALAMLALLSLAGFVFALRRERAMWQVAAAAILLGMTGYALQGRPDLPASPAKALAAREDAAVQLVEMRQQMDQNIGNARTFLITADSFAKQGDYTLSAAFIQSGLRKDPDNPDLWSALGLQLMLASNGQMSAPAQLAFDKAREIRPNYPAPYYFAGVSRLFDGNIDSTILLWERALALASPKAKWKPKLEAQLAGARALKEQAQAGPVAQPSLGKM